MRSLLVAVGAISLFGCLDKGTACAQDASPIVLTPMKLEGGFAGKKDKPATDISGMACMPLEGTQRTCLVINDENKNAQFSTLRDDRVIVGQPIPLIGKKPDPKTLGLAPDLKCQEVDDFDDIDGEGVAYAEPYFYVVGSHGCSRSKGKFRLSSFILARVRVDRQGRPSDSTGSPLSSANLASAVETTYRVSDLLKRAGAAKEFYGKDLETANGLNIEGIAADGDTIWFGLRAPVDNQGVAFVVGGNAADLFKAGQEPSRASPQIVPVKLEGRGIRDLAILPDKRLLVLAGAAHGPEVPFRLFVVDPTSGTTKQIGPLPEVKQDVDGKMVTGKAEAVTVLGTTADQAQIVVSFDALLNGAPHLSKITIPK
jgi:hypothetical protein